MRRAAKNPGFVLWLASLAFLLTVGCGVGPTHTGSGDGGASDGGVSPDAYVGDPNVDDDGDGFTELQGDCNDGNPAISPDASEICDDGIDNNCNGGIDVNEPDHDNDGYGPCDGDCNDNDPTINPAALEVPDGVDNDCDGLVDNDVDGDGITVAGGDCDDNDPEVYPGAVEICWDGIDNNCNGFIDEAEPDVDGDGYGPCSGDCDDTDPNIGPGSPEIAGDGIDNNCDFLIDVDIDGDGWAVINGDCDDSDPSIYPGALEICNDGIDNNCNGLIDAQEDTDNDGDGVTVCQGDCDDFNPAKRPGYAEDPSDGMDNDCDGIVDNAGDCDCGTPANVAEAMNLCTPGVTVTTGGNAAQIGIRTNQGYGDIDPRAGCSFFTLSTGQAWSTSVQNGTSYGGSGNPVSTTGCSACPGITGCCDDKNENDPAWVHLQIQVPLNAQGFSFNFIFLSAEYPEFVGSDFNDTFYAVLQTTALSDVQNISFDTNGDPLTVNNNFFEVPPNWTQSLVGTGYDVVYNPPGPIQSQYIGSGSGWLTTSTPVTPGETVHLWFWIHDEEDTIYDSAVVIDNWQWEFTTIAGPGTIK